MTELFSVGLDILVGGRSLLESMLPSPVDLLHIFGSALLEILNKKIGDKSCFFRGNRWGLALGGRGNGTVNFNRSPKFYKPTPKVVLGFEHFVFLFNKLYKLAVFIIYIQLHFYFYHNWLLYIILSSPVLSLKIPTSTK